MVKPKPPSSFPEDEDMDPVGKPYPEQGEPSDDDIPQDSEFERVVQPEPPNT